MTPNNKTLGLVILDSGRHDHTDRAVFYSVRKAVGANITADGRAESSLHNKLATPGCGAVGANTEYIQDVDIGTSGDS